MFIFEFKVRRLEPGQAGFYPALLLICLLFDLLVGRACSSGRANDYRLILVEVA